MPGVGEAIAALEHLAWRGSLRMEQADRELVARPVGREGIAWRGGVREEPSGRLVLLEAAVCDRLTAQESERVSQLVAAAYLGFYDAAAEGVALTEVSRVREWYGVSVEGNYPEAGRAFLRFATTYWTLKVLGRELELDDADALVRPLLDRVDQLLAPLFFPYDGPFVMNPARREHDQRRFLAAFGPKIDAVEFLAGNPILIRDRKRTKRK